MEKPPDYSHSCRIYIQILLLTILMGCNQGTPQGVLPVSLAEAFADGNFSRVARIADSLRIHSDDLMLIRRSDSLEEIASRIRIEFSVPEEEIFPQLNARGISWTSEDLVRWEKYNMLESKVIDGEKYYFKRAASNLKLLLEYISRQNNPDSVAEPDAFDLFRMDHIQEIITESDGRGGLACPREILMDYRITLSAGTVPAGETVRCWLPYPRENHPCQELLAFNPSGLNEPMISPASAMHRTVYAEKKASRDEPLDFCCTMGIRTYARYFDLRNMDILPYDRNTELYRRYTAPQPPHIRFTERIHDLSDEVVAGAMEPLEVVRRIFYWINANIPWTGALEYSVMPDIPEYTLNNMRGDCGMKTLLFMTLARYNGIPVRWQSGWMLHPGEVNLHDWCEVYYEGVGWVPLDISFGLMPSDDIRVREFYISGMDSYRLIVNDDIMAPLTPEKKHFRSEPYDFQRGELEWNGDNLYFDRWRYQMEVTFQ
jgi:hypothetical protein